MLLYRSLWAVHRICGRQVARQAADLGIWGLRIAGPTSDSTTHHQPRMGTTYLIIGCRILREKRVHYVYVQPIGCWWLLDIVGRHDWMAQQVSSLDNDASSWKLLWNTYVAAKIRMFLWRLSKHSLPTEDVRSHRNMASCGLYGSQDSWGHSLIDVQVYLGARQWWLGWPDVRYNRAKCKAVVVHIEWCVITCRFCKASCNIVGYLVRAEKGD